MESLTNPRQERRKAPRTQLKEILYINLEPDNGGIVVNLSEEGLSFRSATPIRQALHPDEPVRLAFLLPGGEQIKVSAAVVWTGQTRKTGGLRFMNVSVATRAQILGLIAESSAGGSHSGNENPVIADEPARIQPPTQAAPSVQPSTSHSSPVRTTPATTLVAELPHLSPLPSQNSAEPAPASAQSLTVGMPHLSPLPSQSATSLQKPRETQRPPEPEKPVAAQKLPESQDASAEQKSVSAPKQVAAATSIAAPPPPRAPFQVSDSTYYPRAKDAWLPPENTRSYRGVFITLLVVALLAGAGWLGYTHRQDVGSQMVQWGQQLQGSSQVATQAQQQSRQSATSQPAVQNGATQTQTASATPQSEPSPTAPASPPSGAAPVTSDTAAPPEASLSAQAPSSAAQPVSAKPTKELSKQPFSASQAPGARKSEARTSDAKAREASTRDARTAGGRTLEAREQLSSSDLEDAAADVAAARRYLEGSSGSRNSAAAAQLLWAAVAKGDPEAENTLAHLYLSGDGVAKSCEQARVLLKAASDHGDSQAEETLTQVNSNRCR